MVVIHHHRNRSHTNDHETIGSAIAIHDHTHSHSDVLHVGPTKEKIQQLAEGAVEVSDPWFRLRAVRRLHGLTPSVLL